MKEDLMILDKLVETGRSFLIVLTKADKVGRGHRQRVLKDLRESLGHTPLRLIGEQRAGNEDVGGRADHLPVLFFSAKTGEGKEQLWNWISEHI